MKPKVSVQQRKASLCEQTAYRNEKIFTRHTTDRELLSKDTNHSKGKYQKKKTRKQKQF